jgi:hypothetical protein
MKDYVYSTYYVLLQGWVIENGYWVCAKGKGPRFGDAGPLDWWLRKYLI